MTNCLIVDDDPLICDLIKHFCKKTGWIDECLSVADGNQALQAMHAQQFDLIFLDYNLPDLKGKSLLEMMDNDIPVIMITTQESFAAESYGYDQILDFILKPVTYERFLKATNRYQQHLYKTSNNWIKKIEPASQHKKSLIVKDGQQSVILKLNEISYVKSESNYVVFHTKGKKVMSLMSLKQLESELPFNFVRIHKSYLINLDFLSVIGTDSVTIDTETLPIGQSYKPGFLNSFEQWQLL